MLAAGGESAEEPVEGRRSERDLPLLKA